jgi:hypothetical protein
VCGAAVKGSARRSPPQLGSPRSHGGSTVPGPSSCGRASRGPLPTGWHPETTRSTADLGGGWLRVWSMRRLAKRGTGVGRAHPAINCVGGRAGRGGDAQSIVCSRTINTSFVERRHGTDRGQNGRNSRRSHRFSKDREIPVARSYFTASRSNFYRPVRTLRTRWEDVHWQQRTTGGQRRRLIMFESWRKDSNSRPFNANRTLPSILDSSTMRESTASFQGPPPL